MIDNMRLDTQHSFQNACIGIASVSLFVVAFAYLASQYVRVKEHNLDVLREIRMCFEQFNGKSQEQCANVAKQQAIPHDFYKREGVGFEEDPAAEIAWPNLDIR